jgi:hypothetical protein
LLINVYRGLPEAIAGTRVLDLRLGIEGHTIVDPLDTRRLWQIEGIYLPVHGRAIGGVRAKLRDQKKFVTFCNQRDLEVLLGHARPGELCPWLDDSYVGPTDDEWIGLCCDEEDLRDDLLEREWGLRTQAPLGILTTDFDIARRVHLGHHYDIEDLFVLLADAEPETGHMPDTRFATLEHRWMRAERRRVRWEKC